MDSTNPNQALWEKGDFTAIAVTMRDSGEALVRSLGINLPARVLDLGCGDGTTAVPLARLGAEVHGIDIARNLVEAGRRRAQAERLGNLRFEHGDACRLENVADATYDVTLSVFGAMFAPRPVEVAREMVRVTKPRGRIVMGNWIPNDPTSFVSQVLRISAEFTPPPPAGFVSPMTWGAEAHIHERFGAAGVPSQSITLARDVFYFRTSSGPEELIEVFRRCYGPTMNAYAAAAQAGRAEELHRALVAEARAHNQARDGGTVIPATFLRVSVQL